MENLAIPVTLAADDTAHTLLSVLNTSDDGTSFDLRLMQVTRSSAAAPLTVLAVMA